MKKYKFQGFEIKMRSFFCFLFATLLLLNSTNSTANSHVNLEHEYFIKQTIQKRVSGTVKDANGLQLSGVTVLIKGTNTGVATDFDGNYSIDANEDDVLLFSYLGFITQEISINGRSSISVVMSEDVNKLDEIVVVGYGTQSKKDLTGSVSVVKGDDILARSNTNVSNAIQGAIAGVSVTRSTSEPGAGNNITIRGITTLQGSNSPLILVDDVPVNDINDVNAAEIESISILKDGASSAIYGSRAAAGVIIITTKKGKKGRFSANYTSEVIINRPTEIRKSVSAVRYMEMYNEATYNDNNNSGNEFAEFDEAIINDYANLHAEDPDSYPDTDWRSLMLKDNSETYRHNLNISGGTERLMTSANFNYETQNALYVNRDWERYTGRINNQINFSDFLSARFNIAFKQTNAKEPLSDITNIAITAAPTFSAIWADGRIAEGKSGGNPYARLLYGGFRNTNNSLIYGKFGIDFKPLKNLKISINAAPNYEFINYKRFNKSIPYWGADDPQKLQEPLYVSGNTPDDISLVETRVNQRSITTQALVNYNLTNGKYNADVVLGLEEFYQKSEGLRVKGDQFLSNEFPYLSQAPVDRVFDNGTSVSEVAYSSVFGRISFDYNKKYFVQGTLRRDGSSRFGKDYRWGNFPSAALSWVVSEEDFLKSLDFLNLFKIRASYGELGNDRIGNYLYISSLQFSDVLFAQGDSVLLQQSAAQTDLAVQDITWETTTTKNIGIDGTFFDNKLSLTAEYFEKNTIDMLLGLSIPNLSGFSDPTVNVGDMKTTGWELNTTWQDNIGELKYSVSANLFDSKSIVGYVAEKRLFSDGNRKLSEQGIEFRSWYGYLSDGIYQTQEEVDDSATTSGRVGPGDIKYKDISGPDGVPDGIINEDDQTVITGSLPRYQYGGNINLKYKRFDFGLVFQGVGKQKFYLSDTYRDAFYQNWLSPPQILDGNYWSVYNTPEQNLNASYPRLGDTKKDNNNRFSDFWLIDGSYLRIKNLTLGYSLPSEVTDSLNISGLRFYISGNDIFTFDNLPNGIDPEQGGGYLITESYLLGLKINF